MLIDEVCVLSCAQLKYRQGRASVTGSSLYSLMTETPQNEFVKQQMELQSEVNIIRTGRISICVCLFQHKYPELYTVQSNILQYIFSWASARLKEH